MPVDRSLFPLLKTPIINLLQQTVRTGDAFEDTKFKPGFDFVRL
jgi:hypothetical protein